MSSPAPGAPGPAGPPGPAPAGACLVCHSPRVDTRDVAYVADASLRRTTHLCRRCGYVAIDELRDDIYRGRTSIDELPPPSTRIGSSDRPGREFQMARMALDILGRKRPQDVLVYGVGNSYDNDHIQRLPGVGTVWIADIMKLRDDAPFIDANRPGERTFPVVVASEVIEHFREPWADFERMLSHVGPRGLLVCGTNIHGGRPTLKWHRYAFFPDHTSYYSPASLRHLAERMGFGVDFRAVDGVAPRKRYVLLSRSPDVLARAAEYFGRVELAPTEATLERERAAG